MGIFLWGVALIVILLRSVTPGIYGSLTGKCTVFIHFLHHNLLSDLEVKVLKLSKNHDHFSKIKMLIFNSHIFWWLNTTGSGFLFYFLIKEFKNCFLLLLLLREGNNKWSLLKVTSEPRKTTFFSNFHLLLWKNQKEKPGITKYIMIPK